MLSYETSTSDKSTYNVHNLSGQSEECVGNATFTIKVKKSPEKFGCYEKIPYLCIHDWPTIWLKLTKGHR